MEIIDKENKTLLEILEAYLKTQNVGIDTFLIDFSKNLPYVVGGPSLVVENIKTHHLNVSYYQFKNDLKDAKKRSYLHVIRTLYIIYGIDYSLFGITDEEFGKSGIPGLKKLHDCIELKANPVKESENEKFIKDYYDMVGEAINNMQTDLTVYTYHEQREYNNPEYLKVYYDLHDSLYEVIEKTLFKKKNSFKYIRFLALPLHDPLVTPEFDPYNKDEDYDKLLKAILRICSVPMFKHITRCMIECHDVFNNTHTGFFLLARPPRQSLWGIVDKGKYIISEYYKYDTSCKCQPNLLFVESKGAGPNNLYDAYLEDKIRHTSTLAKHHYKNPRIRSNAYKKDKIEKLLLELYDEAKGTAKKFLPEKNESYEAFSVANEELNAANIYMQNVKEKIDFLSQSKLS